MCVQGGTSGRGQVERLRLELVKAEKQCIEDVVYGKDIGEKTITDVAENLRIIADELNNEYSRISFRNIILWVGIIRKIWI